MIQLDPVDRNIVRELQRDGTLSQSALAESVGASAASCWRRIKSLERQEVLGRTVRLANGNAIGLGLNVFCRIRLVNHLPVTSKAFETFLDAQTRIMECYAISGNWDYLLRVVSRDVADYESFLRDTLLALPVVAASSSEFALSQRKYTTELPV